MINFKPIISILFILLFICCSEPTPKEYLITSLEIMQNNSIHKNSIDWKELRNDSFKQLESKKTLEEVYPIIEQALEKLGTHHSFFHSPEKLAGIYDEKKTLPEIESRIISSETAYIKIPGFLGNESLTKKFAIKIQSTIRKLDDPNVNNWIIDLTSNWGGNMWPMYLGLAPILKEGVSGYFVSPENKFLEWNFSHDAVYEGDEKMLEISNSYYLRNKNPKIAVLISRNTASSGEAIAIMFKDFPNTKLIGEFSYGVTTGNTIYDLSDGARIVLTTAIFADRKKIIYGGQITPDIFSQNPVDQAVALLNKKEE
ncbi:Peptidase family S41 [Pricia antarctica]|uniref:Peptidase family S41 n=1 Tax=Pricia antarctica TaxID=641691 RepID=A0A1G7J8Z2_9FLAO|nr:S41 family peptidase [Pricia antarctica]SDF21346.1 Peptidase family S41 [Pricia antarctica]